MILDAQNLFSDAQAVTAAAASTNLIDLGAAQQQLGVGEPLYIVAIADSAFTDAANGNTSTTVALQQDDNSSFSSATTIQTIGSFAAADSVVVGDQVVAHIAPGVVTERYIRLYYTPNGANLTGGTITAFIVKDLQKWRAYAKNSGAVIDLT